MAKENVLPICQDTGMPTFQIHCPVGVNQLVIRRVIDEAISEATRTGKLRPNSVDSITGKNSGLNLGPGTPVVHFEQWEEDEIEILLLLKGGGCENKNIQYSLPTELPKLGRADRDLDGVYKCILHAVWQAQGQGCSQGFLGVCVGGDRTSGYSCAKEQLFRSLDDVNPVPELAELEARVMANADMLGIGTMGFGGAVTLLGCKIAALNRLPASFFVSVAYNCWAYRRLGVRLDASTGAITKWLFRADKPNRMALSENIPTTGREIQLNTPITEAQARSLKVGNVVLLTGPMYTGVRMHLGRTAVLDTGRAQIVVTERPHEPFDLGVFTHAGIDPRKKRYVMLKSRIHYRAGFKPICSQIVECAGAGVTNADLTVYPYRKLTRPIFPLDPM